MSQSESPSGRLTVALSSLRTTFKDRGAWIPRRTVFPFTDNTVTRMLSPMTNSCCEFLESTNMIPFLV